jgi:hypothetical protein
MQLSPVAGRVINRYANLHADMPVRVRFRWGDTARLEVGRSPSLLAQFGRFRQVFDPALDVGWSPMQACIDPDAGAAAARAAIAALG